MAETANLPAIVAEQHAHRLSVDELCEIAERLGQCDDLSEAARLNLEFERGFYSGEPAHA